MKLSNKLKEEILRRWRGASNKHERIELAKRYGYTMKQLDGLDKAMKSIKKEIQPK